MAKNSVEINENDARIILDFLYRIAKTYNFEKTKKVRP